MLKKKHKECEMKNQEIPGSSSDYPLVIVRPWVKSFTF